MYIELIENYGPAVIKHPYRVISRGYDWVLISCNGNPLYIPDYLEK